MSWPIWRDGGKQNMKRIFWMLLMCSCACAQAPQAQDPVQSIVKLFDTYRIVMFGESHSCRQQWDLLRRLVAAPGFAARVNDIVMEYGNARFQDVVDRYTAGEDVPLTQVQRAWRDPVGVIGPVSPVYGEFYAAVRAVNQKLPKERRLRIVLGDPPIDWDQVRSKEDVGPYLPFRPGFYAQTVRYEVIAKKRKALLIMGSGHFRRSGGRPNFIENELLMALVQPYVILTGSNVVGGYDDLEPRFDQLPYPSLIEVKGSWLGALSRPNPRGGPASTWEQMCDAYLYLGPRDTLTVSSNPRSELEGTPYGRELERRLNILFDKAPEFLPKSDAAPEQPAFSRNSNSTPQPPLPAIPKPRP
jgi:hypothetical protein